MEPGQAVSRLIQEGCWSAFAEKGTDVSVESSCLRVTLQELAVLRQEPELPLEAFEEFLGYFSDGPLRTQSEYCFDLGRDWQVLRFLLTGNAEGGLETDEIVLNEVGFGRGPIRCLLPRPVRDVAAALGVVTKTQIRARFDPTRLEALGVYPGGWLLYHNEPLLSQRFEQIWEHFQGMTAFFQAAASADDVVLSWLW